MTPNDLSHLAWEDALDRVSGIIESVGLRVSPYLIDHTGNTPSHLIDETFSLDLQTSNAETYRDVTEMRISHALTVTMLRKLAAPSQSADQRAALVTAQAIVRALNDAMATDELRVAFIRSSPSLTADRAFLVTRLEFRLTHDWYAQPLGGS